MNAEKKLTDEEDIIKDIERSTGMPSYWKKIVLDLIQRQKAEIERLTEQRKRILAYKVLSDETLKGETKADLIERIRILEHNWSATEESLDIQAKNCEILLQQAVKDTAEKFAERLKAQYPPRTDKRCTLDDCYMLDKIDEICKELTEEKV